MTKTERDPAVARVLRRVPVPDHGADFWDDLDRRLQPDDGAFPWPTETDVEGVPVVSLQPAPPTRTPWRRRLVAAAAVVVVFGAGAIAASRRDGREVTPATTWGTDTTTTAPTRPPSSPPGSAEAVLLFLDALGAGDLVGAASHLGPRSEAYLQATAGSVESFLRVAEEGFGAWAASTDRTTTIIEGPGGVVVVVSGTLTVEGTVEHRSDAFPARYSPSAGVWFVEPWAWDPAAGQLQVSVADAADRVEATIGAEGTAWLSVDGAPPRMAEVGPDHRATWRLPAPLEGEHTIVVTFTNDITFAAVALHSPCGAQPPPRFCSASPATTNG